MWTVFVFLFRIFFIYCDADLKEWYKHGQILAITLNNWGLMGLLWDERGVGISSVNIPNIRPSEIEVSGRKKVIEALEEIEPQIIIYLASLLKDDFLRVASLRLINNLVRTTTDETERIMLLSAIVEINLVEKVFFSQAEPSPY